MMHGQLQLRNLRIEHRRHTLVDGIDLTLDTGQICALVGASGSGKSLTCLGILDLLPDGLQRVSGDLLIDDRSVFANELRGREIALVLQNPRSAFNPVRNLRQHALETLRVRGVKGASAQTQMREAINEVGLDDVDRVLDSFAFQRRHAATHDDCPGTYGPKSLFVGRRTHQRPGCGCPGTVSWPA
jgi:nickel transport system ATP-binding protein